MAHRHTFRQKIHTPKNKNFISYEVNYTCNVIKLLKGLLFHWGYIIQSQFHCYLECYLMVKQNHFVVYNRSVWRTIYHFLLFTPKRISSVGIIITFVIIIPFIIKQTQASSTRARLTYIKVQKESCMMEHTHVPSNQKAKETRPQQVQGQPELYSVVLSQKSKRICSKHKK